VFCVQYDVCCKLRTVYCALYTVYRVLSAVLYMLYAVYCILYIVYCPLYAVCCRLCTVSCALYTVYCILYTAYCVLCTVSYILCTVYCTNPHVVPMGSMEGIWWSKGIARTVMDVERTLPCLRRPHRFCLNRPRTSPRQESRSFTTHQHQHTYTYRYKHKHTNTLLPTLHIAVSVLPRMHPRAAPRPGVKNAKTTQI
jgi:hypothetical protein